MEEILWPSFNGEETYEENKALSIITAQVEALDKLTNGRIKAAFSKMEFSNPAMIAINRISRASRVDSLRYNEVIEQELEDKEDANELFESQHYRFEIYNEEYRFRVFSLDYRIIYPIGLDIDEDIAKELSIGYSQTVKSNSELKNLLKQVFTSKKIFTIISYIMQSHT